jgi:hypothetical protein
MSEIPNVFYLYWSGSEFTIHHYICIKSIIDIEKPSEIILYYNEPIPSGNIWCDRSKKYVTLKELKKDEFPEFQDLFPKFIDPQITSDILSSLVLYQYGGIYTDFDTITIQSIRDHINGYDAFVPSCRNATASFDSRIGKYVGIGKCKKPPWSYLANGNLGAKSGHPYYRQVLESFRKEQYPTGHLHYVNAYETNKERFTDLKMLPWPVFHTISERTKDKLGTVPDGGKSWTIEDFFQSGRCKPNKDTRVFHYYSSKGDCAHLVNKLATAYMIRYATSTYSQYATPYINEFVRNWKSDGYIIAPDRIILEQKIIPHLSGNVCFVGVASYIRHYWTDIFPESINLITIDNNRKVAKYGAPNHIVVEAKRMDERIHHPLDYIVMHGIAGYGSYTKTQLRFAFRGAIRCLKPGGLLIYGWANNPSLRIIHPTLLLKRTFETNTFKNVGFRDLPPKVHANDHIDPNIEYNVPLDEFRDMDVQFMFFKKPGGETE